MDAKDLETIEGKICSKCGEWKLLEEYNKRKVSKDGRRPECRECQKEQSKQWRGNNKEHKKEYAKQYYQNNEECMKEQHKRWYENNKEYCKEYSKRKYGNNKQNNLQYISNMVEQISPIFNQLNLPIYGYVYMFENVKTRHKYLGQSTLQLKTRYGHEGGIIKSWIKERLDRNNQKFKEELIEEDIVVTEILDVAFCQYHLDKLESYYINKYDSCNNGYNNHLGNHNTTDGLDEFNEILKTYNLQYIDGKIIKAPTIK